VGLKDAAGDHPFPETGNDRYSFSGVRYVAEDGK
jgi:hypothetical protein